MVCFGSQVEGIDPALGVGMGLSFYAFEDLELLWGCACEACALGYQRGGAEGLGILAVECKSKDQPYQEGKQSHGGQVFCASPIHAYIFDGEQQQLTEHGMA